MYFNYNSHKIFYEKFGNKKQVILILPGWGNNRKTFYNIVNNLKDKFTIYIFDYPGFGNSEIPNYDLTVYNYAEMIIRFINEQKIKKPILIGHSFGGRISILLSGYYQIKLKKIILISAAGIKPITNKKKNIKQKIYKTLKKLAILFPTKIKKVYLEKLISIFGSTDFKNLPEKLRKTFINIVNEDLTTYIKNINVETLIIWGENDIDTPLSDAYTINKLINNSKLKVIKKATHFSYLEYPIYITSLLNQFLIN